MSKEPRDYFEEKSAALINEIKARLEELEYRAETVPWDPDSDERREFDDLRIRLHDTETLFDELRAAADSAWPALRNEMEQRLTALSDTVAARLARVKL